MTEILAQLDVYLAGQDYINQYAGHWVFMATFRPSADLTHEIHPNVLHCKRDNLTGFSRHSFSFTDSYISANQMCKVSYFHERS